MREPQTLVGPRLHDAVGIGALTIGGLLTERCARFADHEALVFDDPLLGGATTRWTYTDLRHHARRVAKALLAGGPGKGTRVGVLMGNRPEAVAALFGTALAGAVAVPLSTFAPKPELASLIGPADVGILLLQTTMGRRCFAADIAETTSASTSTSTSATIGGPASPRLPRTVALGPAPDGEAEANGFESWEAFLECGDQVDDLRLDAVEAQVHPSDPGVIVFSSGTTGRPKGVILSHRAVALAWWMQALLFGRDESTRVWCALPICWTAGLNAAMGATLAAGGTWVMQERFEPGHALRLLERERVTEPHTLPHQARALAEHPGWPTADLSSCARVFGKSVFTRHPSVRGDERWTMPIGYGLSETSSFFTALPSDTSREVVRNGSLGRLLPGNELRVVDPESGCILGPNEEGELIVRGPTLMERYVGRTRAECFDADGFFHTGDLGSYDDHGFVSFSGRRSEMIRTAGANVSPAEVEIALHPFEPIRLARVVGIPDERRDEIVVLCVELKRSAVVTEEEIRSFLRERLAAYKVPTHILFFDEGEIPLNHSGTKVRDERLLAVAKERLNR